jgi:hypothetical protein
VLANLAKSFQSATKLQLGDRQANARRTTAIMALDLDIRGNSYDTEETLHICEMTSKLFA